MFQSEAGSVQGVQHRKCRQEDTGCLPHSLYYVFQCFSVYRFRSTHKLYCCPDLSLRSFYSMYTDVWAPFYSVANTNIMYRQIDCEQIRSRINQQLIAGHFSCVQN